MRQGPERASIKEGSELDGGVCGVRTEDGDDDGGDPRELKSKYN